MRISLAKFRYFSVTCNLEAYIYCKYTSTSWILISRCLLSPPTGILVGSVDASLLELGVYWINGRPGQKLKRRHAFFWQASAVFVLFWLTQILCPFSLPKMLDQIHEGMFSACLPRVLIHCRLHYGSLSVKRIRAHNIFLQGAVLP